MSNELDNIIKEWVEKQKSFTPKMVWAELEKRGKDDLYNFHGIGNILEHKFNSDEMPNYKIKVIESGVGWTHMYYPQVSWWDSFKKMLDPNWRV